MNTKYDVVALGELLIDFIQNGYSSQGNPVFEANPGGAPCNVLSMLSKLGYRTAFIGKVGEDAFGRRLGKIIEEAGIFGGGLCYDDRVKTTLAFVQKTKEEDREFTFYRSPGADTMLTSEEIPKELLKNCRIFHFGSLSLTNEPAASATKTAVAFAKKEGKLISFDPNVRLSLWQDEKAAKEAVWYGIRNCDILKIADDEITWLTDREDYDLGAAEIQKQSEIKLLNVTLGKKGSIAYYNGKKVFGKAFQNDAFADATGAGDTFCACVLGYLSEHGINGLTEDDLTRMLLFANAAASIITTRKGAICSMPDKTEIIKLCGVDIN